jgi:hypothetical protein
MGRPKLEHEKPPMTTIQVSLVAAEVIRNIKSAPNEPVYWTMDRILAEKFPSIYRRAKMKITEMRKQKKGEPRGNEIQNNCIQYSKYTFTKEGWVEYLMKYFHIDREKAEGNLQMRIERCEIVEDNGLWTAVIPAE